MAPDKPNSPGLDSSPIQLDSSQLNSSQLSVAFSISFDEQRHRSPSKRKLMSTPFNPPNSSLRSGNRRFSEFFKAEMTVLSQKSIGSDRSMDLSSLSLENKENLSIDSLTKELSQELSIDRSEQSEISFNEPDNSISNKLSVNEGQLDLSVDNKSVSSIPKRSAARFSTFFREQFTHLQINSPNGSPGGISSGVSSGTPDLSLDSPNLSLDSQPHQIVESPKAEVLSIPPCVKPSPQLSDTPSKSEEEEDCILGGSSGVRKVNAFISDEEKGDCIVGGQSGARRVNAIISSDEEDCLNIQRHCKHSTTILISSDEESFVDREAAEDCRAFPSEGESDTGGRGGCPLDRKYHSSEEDGDGYDSSFIDDSPLDDQYSGEEVEEEYSGAEEGEVSLDELSSEEEDPYHTPHLTSSSTPFFTAKTRVNTPVETKSLAFRTPTSRFTTPASKKKRRETCLATPLSVKSKTGTPGLPNRTYTRNLLAIARELFQQFNENIFGNQLPPDLEIKLNKRLNTTAGRCIYLRKGSVFNAFIELSPKVVDCYERLKETLAHEMCHAAAFIIDNKMDNHGPVWQKWARRVGAKYPELPPVSRCHSYQIQYKFTYRCTEAWCNYEIGRHSKSIDLNRARCPLCFSRLELPTPAAACKTPNKWAEFVKERFSEVKGCLPPRTPHKEVMKALSKEFKGL